MSNRWTRTSHFAKYASTIYSAVGDYMELRDREPNVPLSTYTNLLDNYWRLKKYNANEAAHILGIMGSTMVYELSRHFIDKKDDFCVYVYECIYDPNGKRLGSLHYVRKQKPIDPKKWIFRRLGSKRERSYVGHYDSNKYKKQMKSYKEGKLKSRPNGRTWCSYSLKHRRNVHSL